MIILHEILNDVIDFKALRDPDSAADYQQKLVFINQRRDMISFLNGKYGAGAKTFLDILQQFKADPLKMMQQPNAQVKQLISETLDKYNREQLQPFEFKNESLGDMLDLIADWWDEVKGGTHVKVDEVPMKQFMQFALKKRIIIDEKELETLFKDLSGSEELAESHFIR